MLLSSKAIITFSNTNSFAYGNQWVIRGGESNTLYFQVVDLDQNGLRYMAGLGGSDQMIVIFPSIDDRTVIRVQAYQDSNDASLWSVNLGQEQTPFSGNVMFSLTDNGTTRNWSVTNMISVQQPFKQGSC